MANEKNLKPLGDNSPLPKSKQREIQSKGGKARAKQRAENRRQYESWKKMAELFLPMALKQGKLTDIKTLSDLNNSDTNITVEEKIFFTLLSKAMKGDVQAIRTLFELTQWNKQNESGNTDGNTEVNAFIAALNGKASEVWDDEAKK